MCAIFVNPLRSHFYSSMCLSAMDRWCQKEAFNAKDLSVCTGRGLIGRQILQASPEKHESTSSSHLRHSGTDRYFCMMKLYWLQIPSIQWSCTRLPRPNPQPKANEIIPTLQIVSNFSYMGMCESCSVHVTIECHVRSPLRSSSLPQEFLNHWN